MSSAKRFQLFACGLYLLSSVALAHAQTAAQAGFSLSASGVSVDRAEHWEAWTRPKHAVEIDPHTHAVRPRTIRIETNAVEGMGPISDPHRRSEGLRKTTQGPRPCRSPPRRSTSALRQRP